MKAIVKEIERRYKENLQAAKDEAELEDDGAFDDIAILHRRASEQTISEMTRLTGSVIERIYWQATEEKNLACWG